ncbi:MAG: 4Fe-4S dicluster domain-containing protein, partial [Vulcanimicrobiaceae bacterium]
CISGCPYKKVFYNWSTGKSEKCVLCFPRLETGQAPACFHSCVGRIRYLGVLLYDADRIEATAKADTQGLVEAQREMILDPFDPHVIAAAKANGIAEEWIESAQRSPVYKFVKQWKLALPLHPEFRTLPMLFYIPPLSPVMASMKKGTFEIDETEFFGNVEQARVPLRFMANLFSAGNIEPVSLVLRRLIAVRAYKRSNTVGDITPAKARTMLDAVGLAEDQAEAIFRLTSLPTVDERFVIPPYQREAAVEELFGDPLAYRGATGFGPRTKPHRGP